MSIILSEKSNQKKGSKMKRFTNINLSLLAVLFSLLITVGCATYKAPKVHTFDNSKTYFMDYDEVWNRVIEWFATNGTPVKNIEKSSGFIAAETVGLQLTGLYCDCGKAGTYDRISDGVGNFNVHVLDQGASVRVNVNATYNAIKNSTNLYSGNEIKSTISCNSTGWLEKKLLDYIGEGEDVHDESGT